MPDTPSIEVESIEVVSVDRYGCHDDLFTLITNHKPSMGEQMVWEGVVYTVKYVMWHPADSKIKCYVEVK